MRTLVILAFLGCACAVPLVQDTPEVVAERARFQQLYNAAAAAAAAAPDDPVRPSAAVFTPQQASFSFQAAPQFAFPQAQPQQAQYVGPFAATIPAGLPGAGDQVPDTAEVASARNAFLAAYRAQVAATTGVQQFQPAPVQFSAFAQVPAPQQPFAAPQQARWTGPVAATIPAGVDGTITPVGDTAEVAAARSAFLIAYNNAVAATVPNARPSARPSVTFSAFPQQPAAQPVPVQKWTGPVAATVPAGLPGSTSQVAPTQEVAAATQAFNQAYSAAVAATTGRRF